MVRMLLTLLAAMAISTSALGGTAVAGTGGNVGTAHGVTGTTYDVAGHLVNYTCSAVHRTRVAGGMQDKQTCALAQGATLPEKMTRATFGTGTWASDYVLATTGAWETATSWTQQFMPDGTDVIVSFYAAP